MIIEIKQTKTGYNLEWQAFNDSKPFATIYSPAEMGQLRAGIEYPNGKKQMVVYNPSDRSHGSKLIDRLGFYISENNIEVGSMKTLNCKVKGFFQSYQYIEYLIDNETFKIYEVGMGTDGYFICFYHNERLIAIVQKNIHTVNFKDMYTAYVDDDSFAEYILPPVIYIDVTKFGNIGDINLGNKSTEIFVTPQKELKAKYDPEFIPKVKQKYGIK